MRLNKTLTYLDISYNLIGSQVHIWCSVKGPQRWEGRAWLLHRRSAVVSVVGRTTSPLRSFPYLVSAILFCNPSIELRTRFFGLHSIDYMFRVISAHTDKSHDGCSIRRSWILPSIFWRLTPASSTFDAAWFELHSRPACLRPIIQESINYVRPEFYTGAEALADWISTGSCALTHLDVSWNTIRLDSAVYFGKALAREFRSSIMG